MLGANVIGVVILLIEVIRASTKITLSRTRRPSNYLSKNGIIISNFSTYFFEGSLDRNHSVFSGRENRAFIPTVLSSPAENGTRPGSTIGNGRKGSSVRHNSEAQSTQ